jgi:D-alanyl-D-alanine carboxypeptidase (penicillin-binding protein 5/6)
VSSATQPELPRRAARARRWGAATALAVALAALALTVRVATEASPPLALHLMVAAQIRIAGAPPRLRWPHEGEAAAAVAGVGELGTSGSGQPVPIASVAKVMTAYVILRDHPLAPRENGFTIVVSAADVREQQHRAALGESTVPVRAGERITERQALEALLIPSANNVAALLAVAHAGSIASFVAEMNSAARTLGMSATVYTDPSGFAHSTVSTAADQLKLAGVAMRLPTFAAIVALTSTQLPVAGRVANYNGLAGSHGYVGVKTGSDGAAGGCLMFAKQLQVGGRRVTVLGVVLGARRGPLIRAALASGQALGDSAAAAVAVQTLLPTATGVLRIAGTSEQRAVGATAEPLRALGWGGLSVAVRVRARGGLKDVRSGAQVGIATVAQAGSLPVAVRALRSIARPSLGWRVAHALG